VNELHQLDLVELMTTLDAAGVVAGRRRFGWEALVDAIESLAAECRG